MSSSAFPTGGFSHSMGLEAFFQLKGHYRPDRVQDPKTLWQASVCIIENAGSLGIPFVKAAYQVTLQSLSSGGDQSSPSLFESQELQTLPALTEDEEVGMIGSEKNAFDQEKAIKPETMRYLYELDKQCEACTTNHIAKRASTRQGRSLLESALSTFPGVAKRGLGCLTSDLPHCHQAVVHGALMASLGLTEDIALSTFMFSAVRTLVAAAVRLDVVGTMEGQKMQYKLQEVASSVIKRNQERPVERACIRFPVPEILQNSQDTLFSKLFYS